MSIKDRADPPMYCCGGFDMTSPSREAFEAQDRARYDIDAALYSHDHMGRYRDRPIQCRWETWQAAIQHARDVAVKACHESGVPRV